MNKKAFISIRYKLAFTVGSFFVLFILGFLLMNQLFLEDFYIFKLESDMNNTADTLLKSEFLSLDTPIDSNNDLKYFIRELSTTSGYRFEIVDMEANVLLSSVPSIEGISKFELPLNIKDYLSNVQEDLSLVGSDYVVLTNPQGGQDVVTLTLLLTDGTYLIITKHLEEIQSNVAIADEFFLIIGLLLTFIWVVVTYILSKTITNPIIRIGHQAKEIAAFDFDSRYDGPIQDEIGELGQYMNHISGELEGRITELSRLNTRLKNDMSLQRRFLASISHEFKSPVGIIKGYAESIKLGYYKNDVERNLLVDRILESSDQMTALVEDMIMLSMLDKREFKLRCEDINLSNLLKDVCHKKMAQYKDSPVNFQMTIQENIVFLGDTIRMVQVFDNLLDNGFRYTTEPWHFHVSLSEENNEVQLTFSNNCQLVESQNIEQIFTPFYRFEKSHSKKTGGHGLGLSIVKALVEAQGGFIDVHYKDHDITVTIRFQQS